jgi:hypothetical protein
MIHTDEALRLALKALTNAYWPTDSDLLPAHNIKECAEAITAIKAALEAKDEPWEKFCDSHCVWTDHHPDCKLAQRTWVGLTDEEIEAIAKEHIAVGTRSFEEFAHRIEAKLKEKNT